MKLFTLLTAFLLVAFAVQAQPRFFPQYFQVTGVASDDTLNVRAAPDAGSADIGDLPHDATGVEVHGTDASGQWGQIIWQEGMGWISMRFLAPFQPATVTGTALPAGLSCGGTEPFWSLNLSQGSAVYSDMGGASHAMNIAGARVANGMLNFPVMLNLSGASAGSIAIIQPGLCGDGMSDRDYPYLLSLILDSGGSRQFMAGCCNLPLEAGSH